MFATYCKLQTVARNVLVAVYRYRHSGMAARCLRCGDSRSGILSDSNRRSHGYILFQALRIPQREIFVTAGAAVLSICFLFSVNKVFNDVLQPHQQQRIKVSLGIEEDLRGAGYNVNQSKIAIGSGGTFGKGFLNGTQTKLKYVPEQHTDFIFCTIGEEEDFWDQP